MKKETYYFSHDCNARNDEKILMLRSEHGWEGYGIYWALIETMYESTDTKLCHAKLKGISLCYNIDITLLQSVINTAITESLFVSDGEKFWSESLLQRKQIFLDSREKKSLAGIKGMGKRWKNQQNSEKNNTVITPLYQNDNIDITLYNKGKEKERKGKVKESSIFIPPTLDEIKTYIAEKKYSTDPLSFYNYFSEGNWIDSKGNKVKNWKQKLITWESHNNKKVIPAVGIDKTLENWRKKHATS